MSAEKTFSTSFMLSDLPDLAGRMFSFAQDTKIWHFEGQMGVGKTRLIAELCRRLEVKEPVNSPTYTIVNEYLAAKTTPVYHFDCYRLRSNDEAYDLGFEEYLSSGNYCFIEWASKIDLFLQDYDNFLTVELTFEANNLRTLNMVRYG